MIAAEAQHRLSLSALCPNSAGHAGHTAHVQVTCHTKPCVALCCWSPLVLSVSHFPPMHLPSYSNMAKSVAPMKTYFLYGPCPFNHITIQRKKICSSHSTETVYRLRDFRFVSLSIKERVVKVISLFTVKDS